MEKFYDKKSSPETSQRSEYSDDMSQQEDVDDMKYDIVLNYKLYELEFDEQSNGIILFQLTPSYTPIPLSNIGDTTGIYHYTLPIPSYSGVLCLIHDKLIRQTVLNSLNLVNQYLSVFFFDISMKLTGKCSIQLDNYLFSTDDLDMHTLWSYEFDSIINHAIGVGTKNGYIKGTMTLSRLPRYCNKSLPRSIQEPREVLLEEVGEGSLAYSEFLPEIESVEEPLILPKSSPEPFEQKEKPLYHFMSVDDSGQIQTEYRPGYRMATRELSLSPTRRSVDRPRWSFSQSNRSVDHHRDHLLRCVACWLRSAQCQNCQDDQLQLNQLKMAEISVPILPRHQSSYPLAPPQTISRVKDNSHGPKRSSSGGHEPKQRPRSQPRSRSRPNTNPAPSMSRLRQDTFSSAIAKQTPTTGNTLKPSRGFHFINPQPDTLHQERSPRTPRQQKTKSPSTTRKSTKPYHHTHMEPTESHDRSSSPSRDREVDVDPLQDDYYPKISSPLSTPQSERDERNQCLYITPRSDVVNNDYYDNEREYSSPTLDWKRDGEILYFAP